MRPVPSDAEVLQLAEFGVRIERHYGAPQDTEWAFDGDGNVWMLQSRTVARTASIPQTGAREPAATAAVSKPCSAGLARRPASAVGQYGSSCA